MGFTLGSLGAWRTIEQNPHTGWCFGVAWGAAGHPPNARYAKLGGGGRCDRRDRICRIHYGDKTIDAQRNHLDGVVLHDVDAAGLWGRLRGR